MQEYEDTAMKSLEELKEQHAKELLDLREELKQHYLIGHRPVNRTALQLL